MNKASRIAGVVFIIFIIFGYSVYSPVLAATPKPTKTPKPTPTLTQQQTAIRLARGQQTALAQVAKREKTLKNMLASLEKRKGQIFETDRTELTAMVNDMLAQLPQWRADINASTTIDGLKQLQLAWIKKTRIYLVFQPRFSMLVKIGVFNKSVAQINKRLDNLTARFGNKYNNDKNKRYENVSAKLDEAKTSLDGITAMISATKAKILALTPDLYNTNNTEYDKQVSDIKASFRSIRNKITKAFALLGDISSMLAKIRNVTPTPTP